MLLSIYGVIKRIPHTFSHGETTRGLHGDRVEAASLTAGATALHCAVDTMRCQHISRRGDPALDEALCRLLQKGGKSQKIRRNFQTEGQQKTYNFYFN